MTEETRNKPKPRGYRFYLKLAVAYFVIAGMYYYTSGFAVITVLVIGVALLFVSFSLRAARGWTEAQRAESGKGRPRRRWTGLILTIVLAVGANYFVFNAPTINGRPILAGPVLRDIHLSASRAVGSEYAAPGHRFVVFDTEIASRLGVPLQSVYDGVFALEVDGELLEPARYASQDLLGECDGLSVPRWESRRCSVIFEVPTDTETVRLYIDVVVRSHSGDLDLRELPQAQVPRVELTAEEVVVTRLPSMKRVEILVEARPVDGAAPVSLHFLILRDARGGDYFDRSEPEEGGCNELTVEQADTCRAIYFVPLELETAQLTFTTYGEPLPGAPVSAGVANLQF